VSPPTSGAGGGGGGGDGGDESDGPGDASDRAPDVDPVTLEVVRNAAVAVAEEMNANLVRTSHSPNIKERRDCSTALFDPAGEMVAQAETIPVHLGAMPFSVAAAVEAFPPDSLAPGDAVLLNDPFRGGAHLPDLTLVSPVFHGDEVVAYAANRAHHADVGGSRAGSIAADATEVYGEGVRIPPVRFVRGGEVQSDLLDVLCANVRTPEERRGDLRAQVAANETGRRRFRDLAGRYGADLAPTLDAVKDYSERRMRAEIRDLPDGTYSFADALDDDGQGTEDVPIEATVTVDDDAIAVDFDGTAAQTRGPVNAVLAVTVSATYYAVRCLTDPEIPPNHGCYRPITVEAPPGTVVNPDPPAAVAGGNVETSQRVADVVLGALAAAVPERACAAGQGTMNNVTLGGTDPRDGSAYAFYETNGGGFGGRAGADGMDGVHVHMSNTLNTPAEVLETAYPLRVRRYALRPDSGGAGEHRGGLGLRRDVEIRGESATFTILAERHRSRPYGLLGGEPGESGAAFVRAPEPDAEGTGADGADADADGDVGASDAWERIPAKTSRRLDRGTVVSVRTPGAGGYGDPDERDADAIRRDLRLGKLSPAAAREAYGPAVADVADLADLAEAEEPTGE
jgi:N-methylhydantoinase B